MSIWYESGRDTNAQILVACRVRVARNLADYPFSMKLQDEQAKDLVNTVGGKFFGCGSGGQDEFSYYALDDMEKDKKSAMAERFTITPLLRDKEQACALLTVPDESRSIMINEEDHLRIQAVSLGDGLEWAYQEADRLDDMLSSEMEYAYNHKYGYITTCPTSMGTGLRASYVMHLPFLEKEDLIRPLTVELNRLGYLLKNCYQDAVGPLGSLYQISNQRTLGLSENEILTSLKSVAVQIVDQERQAKDRMLRRKRAEVEDAAWRSYGMLRYGRQFDVGEAFARLSDIRVGFGCGMLRSVEQTPDMYTIMMNILPSTLMEHAGRKMGTQARHAYRAQYIRRNLPKIVE